MFRPRLVGVVVLFAFLITGYALIEVVSQPVNSTLPDLTRVNSSSISDSGVLDSERSVNQGSRGLVHEHHTNKIPNAFLNLPFELHLMIMENLGAVDTARMAEVSRSFRHANMEFLKNDPRKLVETMWKRERATNSTEDLKFAAVLQQIKNPVKMIEILREMHYYILQNRNQFQYNYNELSFKAFRNVLKSDRMLTLIGESFEGKTEEFTVKLEFLQRFQTVYGRDNELFQAVKSNSAMKKAFSISEDTWSCKQVYKNFIESYLTNKKLSWEHFILILERPLESGWDPLYWENINGLFEPDQVQKLLRNETMKNGFIKYNDFMALLTIPQTVFQRIPELKRLIVDEDLIFLMVSNSKLNSKQLEPLIEILGKGELGQQVVRNVLQRVNLKEILNRQATIKVFNSILSVFYNHTLPNSIRELVFDEEKVLLELPLATFQECSRFTSYCGYFQQPQNFIKSILESLKCILINADLKVSKTGLFSFDEFVRFSAILLSHNPQFATFIFDKEVIKLVLDKSEDNSAQFLGWFIRLLKQHIPNDADTIIDELFTEQKVEEFLDRNSEPSILSVMVSSRHELPKNIIKQVFDYNRLSEALKVPNLSVFSMLRAGAMRYGNPNNVLENVLFKFENVEKLVNCSEMFPLMWGFQLANDILKYSTNEVFQQIFTEARLVRLSANLQSQNLIDFIRLLYMKGNITAKAIENSLFSTTIQGAIRSFKDLINFVQLAKEIGISAHAMDEAFFKTEFLRLLLNQGLAFADPIDFFNAATMVPSEKASLFLIDAFANAVREIETNHITKEMAENFFKLKRTASQTPNLNENVLEAFNDANVNSKFDSVMH